MPFADTSLRDEYAAAVERVAGRTLDALRGAGGAAALADPGQPVPRSLLAAARVLGPDLFAPQLLGGAPPDDDTAALADAALRAFPAQPVPAGPGQDPEQDPARLVGAWQAWATARLLGHPAPPPEYAPAPRPHAWQPWSVRMAQLSALALPGLDSPLHRIARAHPQALARGAVRSMLRRDHRTTVRLARWLAWHRAEGKPLPLDVEPLLERLHFVGDGSARTGLELAVADALLGRSRGDGAAA
ncbi:hypothetical protein ACWGB8_15715 [Kitasatospora sp. NPDC054939]